MAKITKEQYELALSRIEELLPMVDDVLSGHDQITGSELREEVCRRGNIVSWKFYNSLLNKAIDEKVIMKSFDHVGHVIYTMAPF